MREEKRRENKSKERERETGMKEGDLWRKKKKSETGTEIREGERSRNGKKESWRENVENFFSEKKCGGGESQRGESERC